MILNVDWDSLKRTLVPDTVRTLVEGRLALLWRFLDCSRLGTAARHRTPSRSEDFQIHVGDWTINYAVDLATGAAIVTRAVQG
ncbi:MAG TPA: hypothetical protein VEP66_10965 [Myxococcales bacterium]|nr:hypothetical protein [Myxococcales bacterium]